MIANQSLSKTNFYNGSQIPWLSDHKAHRSLLSSVDNILIVSLGLFHTLALSNPGTNQQVLLPTHHPQTTAAHFAIIGTPQRAQWLSSQCPTKGGPLGLWASQTSTHEVNMDL